MKLPGRVVQIGLAFIPVLGLMIGERGGLPATPRQFNVLLITLDTVRADRIGCYGYARAETPHLDRLAAEGLLVEFSIAVAPLTLPSHASIMTGLYPPSHGVRDNSDFRLPQSAHTLAEHLAARGYSTAAVVGSIVLESSLGLAQGFQSYDEPRTEVSRAPGGSRVSYQPLLERPAVEVTDASLAALSRFPARPFFLWAHYYDPHHDYTPPLPYSERHARRPYDGEIAYTDAQIGRILQVLRGRRLLDNTLVVVTADHGESLGEHGEDTHGLLLYDGALHVPLIARLPGVIPARSRRAWLASGVDLAPTIVELLSLPPMPDAQGKSFAAAARGGRTVPRGTVYSEAVLPERAYGWSPLFALRDLDEKFIDAPEPELYDLASDPGERLNVAAVRPRDVSLWKGRLMSALEAFGRADASAVAPMDSEQRERLASLGYLSGGRAADAKGRSNPRDRVAIHKAILRARELVSAGRLDEARSRIAEVVKVDPDNPAALSLDGILMFSRGDREQGLGALRAAARSAPGVYENQRNLGNALHLAGRLDEAVRAYRTALAIRPHSGEAHYALGNVLFAMKETESAVREYREAIRLGPGSPPLRAALGVALAAVGDSSGAEAALKRAVADDPSLAGAWTQLAKLAEKAGRRIEARRLYERALDADPDSADALFGHSRVCLLLRRLEAAQKSADRLFAKHPSYSAGLYLQGSLKLAQGDKPGAKRALLQFLARPQIDPQLAESARELLDRVDR